MEPYKIKALRIYQLEDRPNGQAIYSGKIQAVNLINPDNLDEDRFTPDYWTREKKLEPGYQRPLNPSNIEKIKNYILKETPHPLFPTSVVVNSRTPLKFKDMDGSYGELEISNPLFVIDGQHRIEAFKELMKEPLLRGKYGTYEIPIVVLSGFEYIRELEQFFIINSRQTKIKFDLAQRMYMEMMKADFSTKLVPESKRWQTLAGKAVDCLNEGIPSKTVWYGSIQLPDDSKDIIKTRIITQNSFISSLKPFFSGGKRIWNFNAIPEKKHNETLEELTELLTKFWNMVGEVYPQIVNNPKKYTLLKTVGVYSLHIFLADVVADTQVFNIDTIIENAKKKLMKAKEQYAEVFWEIGSRDENDRRRKASGFSSAAGHNRIASALFSGRSVDQI